MNRINPAKLLNSKWTATKPCNKERHFIVVALIVDETEKIVGCVLESVINKNNYSFDWELLKDKQHWEMGWVR